MKIKVNNKAQIVIARGGRAFFPGVTEVDVHKSHLPEIEACIHLEIVRDRKFTCKECEEKFDSLVALKKHKASHKKQS